jgi:hypothetical protein
MFRIQKDLFPEPSGSVAGTIIAMYNTTKGERRAVHAYILTDAPLSVTWDKPPAKLTTQEARNYASAIRAFCDAIEGEEANK